MKHFATFLMLLICTGFTVRGQYRDAETDISVSDTRIVRSGTDVVLSFRVGSQKHSVGRNYSAAMQPVISDGENKVSFPVVLIQGKRARMLDARYAWAASGQTADYPTDIVRLLPGQQEEYNAVVEYQPWMEGARLTLEKLVWGCCTSGAPESAVLLASVLPPAPIPAPVPVAQPEPQPSTGKRLSDMYKFVIRDSRSDDYNSMFSADRENSLTIYYRVNRTDIEPDFDDNRATLNQLTTVITKLLEASDSKISRIIVAGFASPEGVLSSNDRLAQGRAESVKAYIVEKTALADSMIVLYNGSEDWYGLRLLIADSDVEWKEPALDIMDNTTASSREALRNERLQKLKSLNGGVAYRYMLRNFFPKLRNGTFIRVYYDDTDKRE